MHLSDGIPVQTPKADGDRNAEFTKFMRTYQNMVFSTAARLTPQAAGRGLTLPAPISP